MPGIRINKNGSRPLDMLLVLSCYELLYGFFIIPILNPIVLFGQFFGRKFNRYLTIPYDTHAPPYTLFQKI